MADRYPPTHNLEINDLAISSLGIGTWAWGDRILWGYGGDYHAHDLKAAFDASLEAGVAFFDTAEVYGMGRSERLLGQFIREADADIRVATKFFPFPWRFGRKTVVSTLKRSLARLGLSAVDLYQIHWPSPLANIDTLMDGLAECVESGLTRSVGVSNYNAAQMRQAQSALDKHGIQLASNQVEYSLIQRGPELNGLSRLCQEMDVKLIAYSPLGMGMLTGKYTAENPPTGGRARRYNGQFLKGLKPLIDKMKEIGEAHEGKTPVQVACNWVIAKGAIPIPGAKNARQARDITSSLDWSLTHEDVAVLDETSHQILH